MEEMKFALAGGAHMHTDRFVQRINAHPPCRLGAVWDPDEARGRGRCKQYGAEYFAEYTDLLKDESIVGVLVVSETKNHFRLIRDALLAGKHVFVEKPPFYTVEEAEEVRDIVMETGLSFLVSDPIRSSIRQLYCARDLMQAGKIGKIVAIRTRCAVSDALRSDHIASFDPELYGGGMMFDVGCHAVHMLYFLGGKPVSAHAAFSGTSEAAQEYGVEDTAIAVYELQGGVLGVAETSAIAARREDFFLVSGTEGTICCLDRELRVRRLDGEWTTIPEEQWPEEPEYPLYRWTDSIQNGTAVTDCGINDALQFTRMITGAYRASRQAADLDNNLFTRRRS